MHIHGALEIVLVEKRLVIKGKELLSEMVVTNTQYVGGHFIVSK